METRERLITTANQIKAMAKIHDIELHAAYYLTEYNAIFIVLPSINAIARHATPPQPIHDFVNDLAPWIRVGVLSTPAKEWYPNASSCLELFPEIREEARRNNGGY